MKIACKIRWRWLNERFNSSAELSLIAPCFVSPGLLGRPTHMNEGKTVAGVGRGRGLVLASRWRPSGMDAAMLSMEKIILSARDGPGTCFWFDVGRLRRLLSNRSEITSLIKFRQEIVMEVGTI